MSTDGEPTTCLVGRYWPGVAEQKAGYRRRSVQAAIAKDRWPGEAPLIRCRSRAHATGPRGLVPTPMRAEEENDDPGCWRLRVICIHRWQKNWAAPPWTIGAGRRPGWHSSQRH